MIRKTVDVAIVGSGFGGSLMALVLRQQGRSVVLLERGTHPRFAVGESSTPLANLILEGLCDRYGLSRIAPFCKYGSWRRRYPDVVCGVKRGFTYFRHEAGREYAPRPDHANELLVAANPSDDLGDTQWLREHIDHFLVREVQAAGIVYWDNVRLERIEHRDGWTLRGSRAVDDVVEVCAKFLIDASGPSSVLAHALDIDTSPTKLRTVSGSLYTHFTRVARWSETIDGPVGWTDDHPYPCDDAVIHHIIDEGWIWVIRFDNGLTSAGLVMRGNGSDPVEATAEAEWRRVLGRYPSIMSQFRDAEPVLPFIRSGRLQRCAARVAGEDWVMLPHSAYFIDPLLSAGNAHTLLGIERLARSFESHWGTPALIDSLSRYQDSLLREVDFIDRVVDGCYAAWSNFDLLTAYLMYYFAAAHHSETGRRRGEDTGHEEFLSSHDEGLRRAVETGYAAVRRLTQDEEPSESAVAEFIDKVKTDIGPYNFAGLCDANKQNMYPFVET